MRFDLLRYVRFGLFFITASATLLAGSSSWTDLQGSAFKGEPQGVYGPFALFKTGTGKGRRVLFRMLSPADCVRFYKESAGKYERAADWSQAKSSVSVDLQGSVRRLEGESLVEAKLKGLPEPELYVLLFASQWESESYNLPWWFLPTYNRLRRLYGNQMETVFFGVRQDAQGNRSFAQATRLPWLVADYSAQESIDVFKNYAPSQGLSMVLITRQGVPLASAEVSTQLGMKKFIDELCSFMAAEDELNPLFFADRAYYLSNIRPVQFAEKSAPPVLIGNPLRASLLRKNKVDRVSAKLEIAEDGKVMSVVITNKDAMSAAVAVALEKAMKSNFIFVPGIERGKAVAASYDFEYNVTDEEVATEVDRNWVFLSAHKEISIPAWLLLRPIPVPAGEFSQVDHVDTEGKYVMTAVKVGKETVSNRAQMSAFNSDFFDKEGAVSVAPLIGQPVVIDEQTYKWESYESKDGFVDLRNKADCDHSVGYAWAEFEAGPGGLAHLGLGSDDGVKIWLNGKLVHDRWIQRITQIDEDVVPLQLAAGKNAILIKIQNAKGGWSFCFRLKR